MPEDGGASIIQLADVTKVHRSGDVLVEALRGVSFVVEEGESKAGYIGQNIPRK